MLRFVFREFIVPGTDLSDAPEIRNGFFQGFHGVLHDLQGTLGGGSAGTVLQGFGDTCISSALALLHLVQVSLQFPELSAYRLKFCSALLIHPALPVLLRRSIHAARKHCFI